MLDLPPAADTILRVGLISVATLIAILLLRKGVELGVRGVLERRAADADITEPPGQLEKRVRTIARLVVRIGAVVLVTIAVLMVLTEFGIEIGPAVAGLGVVGLAVGFGAQWLIRDWFAGIFIVLENQYSAGDVVRIAGVEGVVEEFSLRRTTLRDLDGTIHTVPNGQIMVTSNLTRLWSRATIELVVPAGTDIGRAERAIERAGRDLKADEDWAPRLLERPAVARTTEVGESGATAFTVLVEVRGSQRTAVVDELWARIKARLTAEGIAVESDHVDTTPVTASVSGEGSSEESGPAEPTA